MKERNLKVHEALEYIKKKRPQAHPNRGFINQLRLYYDLQFQIDPQNSIYRKFVNSMAQKSGNLHQIILADDPEKARVSASTAQKSSGMGETALSGVQNSSATNGDSGDVASSGSQQAGSGANMLEAISKEMNQPKMARCKKCRRHLFTADNIIPHEPKKTDNVNRIIDESGNVTYIKKNMRDFSNRPDHNRNEKTGRQLCTSAFTEPMEWMQTDGENSGRVSCPTCQAKLGQYNWSGSQCSCGKWITPSFKILYSHIDLL
ncbi:Dual specificity protein phosphatase 12 [Smittium culicis]|uniref:Dual specificity protein phosphatase 12 n=1 Tax=Smittium culicis TaxID=133412 RepID=A0A1R1Y324_9FUNG|nr:Dual specificity protein phosphatase 12 [Smittium culicis]